METECDSLITKGDVLEIPALGRLFNIGTLYDLRTEKVIPSLKLWDEDYLEDISKGKLTVKCKRNMVTKVDVHIENSLSDKWKNLDISGELKLSLLANLIGISGSASYLKTTKTDKKKSCVRLEYSTTTCHKELTMEAINNIQHRDVIENPDRNIPSWTHVVVAIQYGAKCNILFETEASSTLEKEKISGKLEAALKNIEIGGKANLQMDEYDKEIAENTTCKIYSDIRLEKSARTFDECLEIYKKIPEIVNSSDFEGVPITIYLLPMKTFNTNHGKLVYELKQDLIMTPSKILEDINDYINRALNTKTEAATFSTIVRKLNRFIRCLEEYKAYFQQDVLKVLLPKAKTNGNTEELFKAIEQHNLSLFTINNLELLYNSIESEKNILTSIFNETTESAAFVDNIHTSSLNHLCIAFTLHVSSNKNQMLDMLESFQNLHYQQEQERYSTPIDSEILKSWVDDEHLIQQMRMQAYTFKEFVEINKTISNEKVKFVVHKLECLSDKPNVYIQVYQEGKTLSSFVPPTHVDGISTEVTHNSITLNWSEPSIGKENVECYEITYIEIDTTNEVKEFRHKILNTGKPVTSFCITNLEPNTSFNITIQPICLKLLRGKSSETISVRTNPSDFPEDLKYEIYDFRMLKLSWSPPKIIAGGISLKSYEIRFKEHGQSWRNMKEKMNDCEAVLKDLKCGTTYEVQVRACFKGGYYSDFSSSIELLTTNSFKAPKNVSVKRVKSCYMILWKMEEIKSEDEVSYIVQYRHANDESWLDVIIPTEQVEMSGSGICKFLLKSDLSESGNYIFQLKSKTENAESDWSDECTYILDQNADGDDGDDSDDDEKFFKHRDIIQVNDISLRVSKFGYLVEKATINVDKSVTQDIYLIPRSKEKAFLRFIERITSLDYKTRNKPIQWLDSHLSEDNSTDNLTATRTGIYHPMDLLFNIIQYLNLPQRKDFYKKLTFCKLAVPVIYKDLTFCDVSLSNVEIQWTKNGNDFEGNALEAQIPLISAARIGNLEVSKSSFCNDLLGFQFDAATGSCGFYDYRSKSTAKRVNSEGVVEGVWFQTTVADRRIFSKTCSVLNLRGDALKKMQLTKKLVTSSDISILFVGELDDEESKKFCLLLEEIKKQQFNLKHLMIIHSTKPFEFKQRIQSIDEETFFHRSKKNNSEDITKFRKKIDIWMDGFRDVKSLRHRFVTEGQSFNHESDEVLEIAFVTNIGKEIIDKMIEIKEVTSLEERKTMRSHFLPLQSRVNDITEAKRTQNRSSDYHESEENAIRVNKLCQHQYESIKSGLPKLISKIINSLDGIELKDAYVRIRYYQEVLDEWCKGELSQKRAKRSAALQTLEKMKREYKTGRMDENEINNYEKYCKDLTDEIVTMSIGIENIMREMGQIYETVKMHVGDKDLRSELKRLFEKLPSLVADMLMRGLALEIMDGDGLSVPTAWLKDVLKEANEILKRKLSLDRDPKIFVVTVLGEQSAGKSTLLNCLFGVNFTVGAGRCTKGAFLQVIPIEIENFSYDALLVIDTEGMSSSEFHHNVTHDNEIATFVLGISDLAIITIRGELTTSMEKFLEISTCAFMRMNLVNKRRRCVFVHQNCDPTCKSKNIDSRSRFMEQMDNNVKVQAKLMNQEQRFKFFQDIIEVSIENDFFYFPGLFEGSPPTSPPNWGYSYHCAILKDHILQKMRDKEIDKTLDDFSKDIERVWNAVLEENFVLSLSNSIELQVRYEMEGLQNKWRHEIASLMFKNTEAYCNMLKTKSSEEIDESYEDCRVKIITEADRKAREQEMELSDFISKKVDSQEVYKDWEDRAKRKVIDSSNKYKIEALSSLKKHYQYLIRTQVLKKIFNQKKENLYEEVRKRAVFLLKEHETITKELICCEFEEFWKSCKEELQEIDNTKIYNRENVTQMFNSTLHAMLYNTEDYQGISQLYKFLTTKKEFDISSIKSSYIRKKTWSQYKDVLTYSNICEFSLVKEDKLKILDLIMSVKLHMKEEYFKLEMIGGVETLKMQTNEMFNCKTLVTEYIQAVINVVEIKHRQKEYDQHFYLTEPLITLTCFELSRNEPILAFKEAQESFLHSVKFETDISKCETEVKQLFEELMRKESTINICNNSIARIIIGHTYDIANHEAYGRGAEDSIPSLIIKNHFDRKSTVHGLVLLDILHALNEENVRSPMLEMYLKNPIATLKEKIRFMIKKSSSDIKGVLERLMKKKIHKLKQSLIDNVKDEDKRSEEKEDCNIVAVIPLITKYIEDNELIKTLGIGPNDLANVREPPDGTRNLREKVKMLISMLTDETIVEYLKDKFPLETEIENPTPEQETVIEARKRDLSRLVDKTLDTITDDLFTCKFLCPFCKVLCDGDCGVDATDLHLANVSHRPIGLAGIPATGHFEDRICQELGWIDYVGYLMSKIGWLIGLPFFGLWEHPSWAELLKRRNDYWKFISYKINEDIDYYYPKMKSSTNIDGWKYITYDKAKNDVIESYKLGKGNELKCEGGIYYRDTRT